MYSTQWGPRSYASVTNSGPGYRLENEDGTDQMNTSRREAIAEAVNLKKKAAAKKAFFRMRMDLEENRKDLGKGNIVAFLLNAGGTGNQSVEKKDINKVLRCSGFVTSQILGITRNDYRPNQIEVLLKDEVAIDTCEIESRLKANGLDVIVSKFDHVEEYLMIYGLPLSRDMDVLENKIRESIKPFVKSILEVTPSVYKEEDGEDFFKGNYDGNWRIKIIPRKRKQVPNYIVVDPRAQVMAKAVYTKKVGDKLEMCSDCFSTDHFKWAPECSGPAKWSDYCEDFRRDWETNSLEIDEAGDETASRQGEVTEETRVEILNKTLVKDLETIETERNELRGKINDHTELLEEVKTLKDELNTLQKENEQVEILRKQLADVHHEKELLEKEVEESNILIKEKHITMRRHASQSGVASSFDNENMNLDIPVLPSSQGFEEETVFEEGEEQKGEVAPEDSEKEPPPGSSSGDVDESEASSSGVKRGRGSTGDSPASKKKEKFPKIGCKIVLSTATGKQVYAVEGKKNKKESDWNFTLINEKKKKMNYNLKDIQWEYVALE